MRIVIDGNDGTGKSTLVAKLNELGYDAQDRGDPTGMVVTTNGTARSNMFYVILDAPVHISRARLREAGKNLNQPYHTVKDLTHYRKRYMEIFYDLPQGAFIDSSGPAELTLEMCLSALKGLR